ncbi:hypothetical protein BJF83_00790 [Nocardiopsis sp. CNR-923]|uniref:hypothetical protein n=1 Tax=Nocardiopsis sp. CNR-923 TaxID=1904965 RepID=UPI00095A5AAC|nr:hypothetical protein [Nocardiopsis sp. CNR-923]OLT29176.1 hypothetical protein BJF83_00790 [Nocardiopsis sp. CNR-923]
MSSNSVAVLAAVIAIVLVAVLAALVAAFVSREGGNPWFTALRASGAALLATLGTVTAMAAFVFSALG